MRVAVLSESPDNEKAVRILVTALLGEQIEPVDNPPLQARGWPGTRDVLPAVLHHVHLHTNAQALVVVVDSDDSPVHDPSHDEPGGGAKACRLCELREIVGRFRPKRDRPAGLAPLKVAIGVAVPAIEAWYRCGLDADASEPGWIEKRDAGQRASDRVNRLKRRAYMTDRPDRQRRNQRAVEEARRLAGSLRLLEERFPNGFGALAHAVRSW